MGVIYLTTNNINGRQYIGVDTNNDPHYYGSGKVIKLALNKYSRTNFTKEILEENDDSKYLFEREQYWIDKYDALNSDMFYNLAEGGKGGAGTLNNAESIERHRLGTLKAVKINRENRKGKTYEEIYGDRAEEEKKKRKLAGLGQKHSEERRRKNSESNKGKIPWNKGKKGSQIAWNKGKKLSTKKYIITTPNNDTYEFIGRGNAEQYIKDINANSENKHRINYSKLFKEKKEKGYNLKIVTLSHTKHY